MHLTTPQLHISCSHSDQCVLILAGESPKPRKFFRSTLPPWMANLGHTPAAKVIHDAYSRQCPGVPVYIATLNRYKISSLDSFSNLIHIPLIQSLSLVNSLLEALHSVKETKVVVNLITTIPPQTPSLEYGIYCGYEKIPKEDWSAVSIRSGKNLFLSKDSAYNKSKSSYPLIGKIICKKSELIDCIKSLRLSESEDDPYMALCEALCSNYNYQICHEKWYDLGHQSTFGTTKRSRFSSRNFNSCTFDQSEFTITKYSSDVRKAKAEAQFLMQLPAHMGRYFPAVFESEPTRDGWRYTMEYIPFPTLSELYLFWSIGPNLWHNAIQRLSKLFEIFYSGDCVLNACADNLYTVKLKQRIQKTLEIYPQGSILYSLFEHDHHLANIGVTLPPLRETIDYLILKLEPFERLRPLYVGHGDLCFNNILLEPVFTVIRTIDPKASWSNSTLGLVDPFYDLAKLNHSVSCYYDSIVNGLFVLDKVSDEFVFTVHAPQLYSFIRASFEAMIFSSHIDPDLLNLLTANLFLSMLPLHSESSQRVTAFALIGQLLIHSPESIALIGENIAI